MLKHVQTSFFSWSAIGELETATVQASKQCVSLSSFCFVVQNCLFNVVLSKLTDVVPFPSITLASVQCIVPEWIKLQVAPLFQVCPLGKWENTAIKLAPLRVGHESYLWSRRIVFVEFYWIHATAKTAASGNDTAVMLTHLNCIFARRKSHSATNVGPWQGNHVVKDPEALDWQNLFGPTRNLDKICLCQISICQAWAHWDTAKYLLTTCVNHMRQEPPSQRSKNLRIYQT